MSLVSKPSMAVFPVHAYLVSADFVPAQAVHDISAPSILLSRSARHLLAFQWRCIVFVYCVKENSPKLYWSGTPPESPGQLAPA